MRRNEVLSVYLSFYYYYCYYCYCYFLFYYLFFNSQLRNAVHDVLSGRSIGRRAKTNVEKPDLSLAVRFDIMNSIVSNRHAPSKSTTFSPK